MAAKYGFSDLVENKNSERLGIFTFQNFTLNNLALTDNFHIPIGLRDLRV